MGAARRWEKAAQAYATGEHKTGDELQLAVDFAAPTGTERVLDIGTGAGHTALALAPKVARVVLTDPIDAMLAAARGLFQDAGVRNAEFVVASAERLPFPAASRGPRPRHRGAGRRGDLLYRPQTRPGCPGNRRNTSVLAGQAADRAFRRGAFIPGLFASPDQNAAFVPLAGQEDGVARAGPPDGVRNSLTPVLDPRILLAFSPSDLFGSGRDLIQNGHRVFLAWVFVREDGIVAEARGDLAHPGSLLAIPITGAAEDGDQLPLRDRPQLAKHLLETLRRVRVVDDHVKGLAEVDPLHPAAHPAEAFQPVPDLVEGQPDGDPGGRGRQCVGGIPSATQLQPQ